MMDLEYYSRLFMLQEHATGTSATGVFAPGA